MKHQKHFPKIVSHRGYGSQHSENMISALKTAVDAKVEMIEIDVHETRDGHFIVHHGNSLNCDTPSWSSLTFSQLQHFTALDESAPLLSDCLKEIGSIPVDIEIKSCVNAGNLVKEIEISFLSQGSFMSSSDYDLLKQLYVKGIKIPLTLIVAISSRRSIRQNIFNARLCIAPHLLPGFLDGVAVYHRLAHKIFINNLQRKGFKVFVWTVDEPKEMERFIALGVNGIITNYPDRLNELRDKAEILS
jgi:glycerophosphoryl diester phosphodiesterase